jgi:hypothetical protein
MALTRGFTNNSPVYTVLNQSNGAVTLMNSGKTARFTPAVNTNALGSFSFQVVDAQGYHMTRSVNLRLMAATAPVQPPVLGLRNQTGALMLELTGENGRSLTVQTTTNLNHNWLDWTNVTGSGAMQLLPLHSLTNETPRYFRAFAH